MDIEHCADHKVMSEHCHALLIPSSNLYIFKDMENQLVAEHVSANLEILQPKAFVPVYMYDSIGVDEISFS
jgi:hypothetical protein